MNRPKPAFPYVFLVLWIPGLLWGQVAGGDRPGGGGGGAPVRNVPQVPASEEADGNEEVGHRHLWEARMRSGNYMVLVNKISFVSKHEYISDGVARVVEVTVASAGSAVARFYYLEPVGGNSPISAAKTALDRMQSLAKEGARRAGEEGRLYDVVKNYPTTTHAHTVEYRLASQEALESLYRNLARTMAVGKGRVFKEPSE